MNLGLGVMVWIGLSLIGLPHPLLWAALSAVLRFVPYVGIWIAALCATLLGAAVDPGWSLAATTLGLFVLIELAASQLVEPQLYGHTTGLSPLSVVIAAIFWSWLWGPIGLIVSTPLTLCLLVAGRHIKALSLLDVLLGDNHALTMPERFYQRALSADSDEIIASARVFLKRNSFANYCDLVLLPALHLARLDLESGTISLDQQAKVRSAMVAVIARHRRGEPLAVAPPPPILGARSTHRRAPAPPKRGNWSAAAGRGRWRYLPARSWCAWDWGRWRTIWRRNCWCASCGIKK